MRSPAAGAILTHMKMASTALARAPEGLSRVGRFLSGHALFRDLDEDRIESLARFTNPRRLAAHQTLFWQGEPNAHFFLVMEGSLKLTRRDSKDRCRVLDYVHAGDVLAEHTLFSHHGYHATAAAMEESEVLGIQSLPFIRHLRDDPQLAWRFMSQLCGYTERLIGEIQLLSTHQAEERVAAFLLQRADGGENGDTVSHVPRLRCDLASKLALSKETTSRVISKFRRAGLVDIRQGDIIITDENGLRALLI
jgi:CRP-like cAMP-binding protein